MKRVWKVLLSAVLCAALLAGCGGSSTDAKTASAAAAEGNGWSGQESADEASPEDTTIAEQDIEPQQGPRKLIHNAFLRLESKEYDKTRTQLLDTVKAMNGYVENSSEEGSAEQGGRWAEYTLRIPSAQYAAFLKAAEGTGSLVRKEESVDDVTRQYVDVQARLESLKVQEARLLELAQQAETMEDLLTIESHLTEVRYQIESYTMEQRTMDDQVDYSTITVALSEVTVYTPVSHSFGSRMRDAFGDSWERFVAGCQDVVIGVIYLLPNLVLLAVVIVVVLLIVKKTGPARRAHKEKKQAERMTPMPKNSPPTATDTSYQALYTQEKPTKK